MESQKNMFQTTNQPWIFHYQRLNHHSITINIPIKSLGILLVVCPTKYLQFSEWISPSAWWLIDPSSPKISPQDWDPSPAIAWTVAWKKWPNSKVYGRYNELVFMGGMSWFINQHSHHWVAPSCITSPFSNRRFSHSHGRAPTCRPRPRPTWGWHTDFDAAALSEVRRAWRAWVLGCWGSGLRSCSWDNRTGENQVQCTHWDE